MSGRTGSMQVRSPGLLRDAQESAGLSVRGLAAAANVSSGLIGHLRSDDRYRPVSQSVAARIEAALGVQPGALFFAIGVDRIDLIAGGGTLREA